MRKEREQNSGKFGGNHMFGLKYGLLVTTNLADQPLDPIHSFRIMRNHNIEKTKLVERTPPPARQRTQALRQWTWPRTTDTSGATQTPPGLDMHSNAARS